MTKSEDDELMARLRAKYSQRAQGPAQVRILVLSRGLELRSTGSCTAALLGCAELHIAPRTAERSARPRQWRNTDS